MHGNSTTCRRESIEGKMQSPVISAYTILFSIALLLLSSDVASAASSFHSRIFRDSPVGINYGRIANNLPPLSEVVNTVSTLSIEHVKTFDADPDVTKAFANTGISLTICIPNEELESLATNPYAADEWINTHVTPYFPRTKITSIAVGNEVSGVEQFASILLPAMQNIQSSLFRLKLHNHIKVSTPHSLAVLAIRFPPSRGLFQVSIAEPVLRPILQFLEATDSCFMVNLYPYLTYKETPQIPLSFALFDDRIHYNSVGFNDTDPYTGLVYGNLFDALVDSVASAVASLGFHDMPIVVTETGWPSEGDPDDLAATLENAAIFNRRLVRHITGNSSRGTPLRPRVQIPTFIFALFDENLKAGAKTENHWGVAYANGTRKYDLGIPGSPHPIR